MGVSVANVPCEMMSEILLAAEQADGAKQYAIDIDKSNFELIRESMATVSTETSFTRLKWTH